MRAQHPARERENDAAREDATAEVSDQITTDSTQEREREAETSTSQQTGGFLPALLAPLAASVVIPLLRQLFA